jgi:hypothetical protein
MDDYRAEGKTYLVASSGAADRYHLGDPARRAQDLSALSTLLRSGQVVVTFPASREHPGDTVTVIKVPR